MHGPFCVGFGAGITGIVLPERGGQIQVPSGNSPVESGLELRPGFALWVNVQSRATIILQGPQWRPGQGETPVVNDPGRAILYLSPDPGLYRIMSPRRHPAVYIQSETLSLVWLETLRALRREDVDVG